MSISTNRITVTKYEEPPSTEEFDTVQIQDSSIYKGVVHQLPDVPVYVSNHQLVLGDVVLFAKYSPDTHEIEDNGIKKKFINTEDILEVYESNKV